MRNFIKKVNKTKTCWLWTGAKRNSGYGVLKRNNRNISAHRYSYTIFNGIIPKGMEVCHSCDIRLCVNPKHLWLGTRSENMIDASKKGKLIRNKIYKDKKERSHVLWARYYKKHSKDLSIRRKIKRDLKRHVGEVGTL